MLTFKFLLEYRPAILSHDSRLLLLNFDPFIFLKSSPSYMISSNAPSSNNTEIVRNDQLPLAPVCHRCHRNAAQTELIKCETKTCDEHFCRKCLISSCKYSKKAANALPIPDWACPVCRNRCSCSSYFYLTLMICRF